MKALIWIIILLLIGWGIWYFMGPEDAIPAANNAPVGEVEANTDIDLGRLQDKG